MIGKLILCVLLAVLFEVVISISLYLIREAFGETERELSLITTNFMLCLLLMIFAVFGG